MNTSEDRSRSDQKGPGPVLPSPSFSYVDRSAYFDNRFMSLAAGTQERLFV
jgi:hypothetical protein